jgi:hypothetical protein
MGFTLLDTQFSGLLRLRSSPLCRGDANTVTREAVPPNIARAAGAIREPVSLVGRHAHGIAGEPLPPYQPGSAASCLFGSNRAAMGLFKKPRRAPRVWNLCLYDLIARRTTVARRRNAFVRAECRGRCQGTHNQKPREQVFQHGVPSGAPRHRKITFFPVSLKGSSHGVGFGRRPLLFDLRT